MDNSKTVTIKIPIRLQTRIASHSIVGTREYQQDTYFMCYGRLGALAVICDGMGGMEHGELASQKAVECLVSDFEEADENVSPYEFFRQEAVKMDVLVHGMRDENGDLMDAGTTTVAVLISGTNAWWLSVGDSRIYIYRRNELIPVNRLHNYGLRLTEKLNRREITYEEYEQESKNAEALISYIGMGGLALVDQNSSPFTVEEGDVFLLCSDGLYKALNDDAIHAIITEFFDTPIEEILEVIMDRAKEPVGKKMDNTTAIIMRLERE